MSQTTYLLKQTLSLQRTTGKKLAAAFSWMTALCKECFLYCIKKFTAVCKNKNSRSNDILNENFAEFSMAAMFIRHFISIRGKHFLLWQALYCIFPSFTTCFLFRALETHILLSLPFFFFSLLNAPKVTEQGDPTWQSTTGQWSNRRSSETAAKSCPISWELQKARASQPATQLSHCTLRLR